MGETKPLGITPAQTVGPFFAYMLTPAEYGTREIFSNDVAAPDAEGERITIRGRVIDGDGTGIPDAVIEIWQADANGLFDHAEGRRASNVGFKGFGRTPTGADGTFMFHTIRPGRVAGPGGALQAPHIAVSLFARGMLNHLATRLYFSDEASNAEDYVLALVPEDRRATLIAQRQADGTFAFDICLQQGPAAVQETVFFES